MSAAIETLPTTGKPLDMHVHLVGNGLGGSGCWLRIPRSHQLMAGYILRHLKLGVPMHHPDFDALWVTRLLEYLRTSSLSATVLLAHEQVYDDDGKLMEGHGSFYVPNDYVLRLAREHPEFLPAVSIHPARADALQELDRCAAAGAVMLKLLPNCQNVDCSSPRYRKFWERMAELGMPLLAHTGGEHTVPQVHPEYADPRRLQLPLECGVKVIAAHCATKSGFGDPEYFHDFAEMTTRFPNFYGDTSAWNVPLRGRHARKCLNGPLAKALVHGSDYPVPVSGFWAWSLGFISWRDYRRCARIANPLERDYQLKLAMGFGADHFTRVRGLLRRSSASDSHKKNISNS